MADGAELTVTVKMLSGQRIEVKVPKDVTVAQLRERLAEPSGIPADAQRLVYAGRMLKDKDRLTDHNFKDGNVIHLVKHSQGGAARAAPPQQAAAPTTASAARTPASSASGPPSTAGFQSAAALMQNPELMQSMMQSPFMQNMLDNPELMRNMLMSNPGYRQLLESNPEIAEAMMDPNILRQSMQAARDPSMMAELMRQQDRALSNVEAMPGGMNFLSRMYRDIQEPLEQGMHGGDAEPEEDNPFASLLAPTAQPPSGPNNEALPNPWASGSSSRPSASASAGASSAASPFASLFSSMGAGAPSATATGAGDDLYDASGDNSEARAGASAPAGMPGFGMPPMGMGSAEMEQMMSSPMMAPMMRSLAENPEMLESMLNQNPMTANNPMMREYLRSVMSNPDALAEIMSPERIRAAMEMQRSMAGGAGAGGMSGFPGMAGFGFPGATAGGTSSASAAPPQERFRSQLEQLIQMGFTDEAANIAALQRSGGNVQMAIEFLLQ